jgi:hypothetical protein
VLIDRPAARLAAAPDGGLLVTPGAPGLVPRRARPAPLRAAGEPERYDRVLVTLPNDVFEQVADPGLLPDASWRLRSIEYFAALCLLLELDRPFSPYYWTNVADRELPFVG